MLRWRLRAMMIAVAVVAAVLAALVPAFGDLGVYRAHAWLKADDAPRAIRELNSPEVWAIVATDPAMAALPEIRAASDPGAAVGRLIQTSFVPNTLVIEVAAQSPSPTTATTLLTAITAQAARDGTGRMITTATTATRVRPVGSLVHLIAANLLGLGILGLIGWGVIRFLMAQARPSGSHDQAAFRAAAALIVPRPRA